MRTLVFALMALGVHAGALAITAHAGVAGKALREAVEYTSKKFARETAEEGAEKVTRTMSRLAAKHGDEAVAGAYKKIGPRAGKIAHEAGEHEGVALRVLSQFGDDAVSVATNPEALEAVARFGDDATLALVRHGTVGRSVIQEFGQEGASALARVTPKNGRRLAMLAADGTLKPGLLPVVRQYGDEACEFIWRNKGSLAVGSALAVFVASPEPFINGGRDLAEMTGDTLIKPLASAPGAVAAEAARRVNWNLLVLVGAALVVFFFRRPFNLLRMVTRPLVGMAMRRFFTKEEARHER